MYEPQVIYSCNLVPAPPINVHYLLWSHPPLGLALFLEQHLRCFGKSWGVIAVERGLVAVVAVTHPCCAVYKCTFEYLLPELVELSPVKLIRLHGIVAVARLSPFLPTCIPRSIAASMGVYEQHLEICSWNVLQLEKAICVPGLVQPQWQDGEGEGQQH